LKNLKVATSEWQALKAALAPGKPLRKKPILKIIAVVEGYQDPLWKVWRWFR